MIFLKDFLSAIDYKITEGSDYMWDCYGKHSYQIESWDGSNSDSGHSLSAVFDTVTSVVYQLDAWDNTNDRIYRWIHPDFIDAVQKEYTRRGFEFSNAIDDKNFIDIDVESDILEKLRAIAKGEEYDTRVTVELELEDDILYKLMTLAHESDVTLNKYIEQILLTFIERKEEDVNCVNCCDSKNCCK